MLRRHHQLRIQLNQFKDAGLCCLALVIAYWLRVTWYSLFPEKSYPINQTLGDYAWLCFIILPGAPLILDAVGFYERPVNRMRRREMAWLLLKGCGLTTLGVILVMFLLKMSLARSVIVLFGMVSFALVFLHAELIKLLHRCGLVQTQLRQRLILIGTQEDREAVRRELRATRGDDYELVSELEVRNCSAEHLIHSLHEHSANAVIISARHSMLGEVEKVVQICELEGVEAWLMADFFKTQICRKTFDEFQGRPMLVFRTVPEDSWQGVAKQTIDVVGAFCGLLLVSPLLVVIAILIKATSPGPVLFRQQRSGLNGRPFTMYKFRSMVTDAEQRKHELEAFNEMSGPVFKVTDDPRVTGIGRILRRFSLDEWPQLWNVLRGEMSLVGPRPLPVDEVRRFSDFAHRRRLSVKPGLTCLWQISGRNEVKQFEDWVKLDLEYIDNWSIWLDLSILARTLPAVLAGTGAK